MCALLAVLPYFGMTQEPTRGGPMAALYRLGELMQQVYAVIHTVGYAMPTAWTLDLYIIKT